MTKLKLRYIKCMHKPQLRMMQSFQMVVEVTAVCKWNNNMATSRNAADKQKNAV